MLGDEMPVEAVVVVELAAHVEAAVGERVVEEAEAGRRLRLPRDVERDVLVERVGGARAVAHRVDVAHLVALVGAIERTGALAEAEVHLAGVAHDVVIHALVPPAEVVRLRPAIVAITRCQAPSCRHVPRAEAAVERRRSGATRGCLRRRPCRRSPDSVNGGAREAAHVAAGRGLRAARRPSPGAIAQVRGPCISPSGSTSTRMMSSARTNSSIRQPACARQSEVVAVVRRSAQSAAVVRALP